MKIEVGDTVARRLAIESNFLDVQTHFEYILEGERRRPEFQKRLDYCFGKGRFRFVWSDRKQLWILWQRGEISNLYFEEQTQLREPTEDLIDRIKRGRYGHRLIQNPHDYLNRCVDGSLVQEARREAKNQEYRREMLKDTAYYWRGLLDENYLLRREAPVLPEKWTRGWRPKKALVDKSGRRYTMRSVPVIQKVKAS